MVNFFFSVKPDTVELSVNITENTDCSDFWVNFTCVASEANPVVYNFLLYEKDGDISQSKSGIWIKKISKGGKYVYRCIALHVVGNVTSSNNVTLTVNGKFSQTRKHIINQLISILHDYGTLLKYFRSQFTCTL